MIFNSSSEETLDLGDAMIVLGNSEKVDLLKALACDQGARPYLIDRWLESILNRLYLDSAKRLAHLSQAS